MRRGQSSFESMLGFTAVVLVILCLCWFNLDRLLVLVYEVSLWFQETEWFDKAEKLLGGGNA